MPEYEICTFNRFILKCAGECSPAHLSRVECAALPCFCNNHHLSCCQLNDSIVLYISCFGSTIMYKEGLPVALLFKYIPCFGSTTVKSTNQIRNNLCIPCNATFPIFPNRKQPFNPIRLTMSCILILQHFCPDVTKKRLGKIFLCAKV